MGLLVAVVVVVQAPLTVLEGGEGNGEFDGAVTDKSCAEEQTNENVPRKEADVRARE